MRKVTDWIKPHVQNVWTWIINNLIVVVPVALAILLGIAAWSSFEIKEIKSSSKKEDVSGETTSPEQPTASRTDDGYILYDIQSDVKMKAGEERTFIVPFGTKIKRYNTKGKITKLSQSGKKYILHAETDATFDLKWIIKKGYEHKIKPKP